MNNKLEHNQIDTSQAFGTLITALRYRMMNTLSNLKNPFAVAVIVLLVTALIAVSLYKDNKVPFREIAISATNAQPTQSKKEKKKQPPTVTKTEDNAPTLADRGIIEVILPKTKATPSVQKAFIEKYERVAIVEMDTYGIPASIIMAQAILESNFGTSELFQKNNASFGIKCFSKSCKPGHCTPIVVVHNGDSHKDFYCTYPSVWASFRDHSKFIVNHSYKKLLKSENTYKEWAIGLEQLGYATDSQYAEKIINIIEKYELDRLDNI